jgi:hypothetical protein
MNTQERTAVAIEPQTILEASAELLDARVKVVHSTLAKRLTEDWEEMRADRDAHMSADISAWVRQHPDAPEVEEVLFCHLTRCSWCRNTLWQSLELSRVPEDHPLYLLLEDAEEWERDNDIAIEAREDAEEYLHSNGASIIFARDGMLLAEQPDGSVIELGKVREEATRR